MRLAAATQWLCLSLHLLCGTSLVAFTHPKPHLFVRRTSNAARANAPHHAFITRQQSTATNCRRAQTSSDDEHTSALALLAAVPVVWGTYAPLVKYTLSLDRAPPVLLFNLASYAASFAALAMTLFAARLPLMSWTALQGGMELGLWLFLGSTVQGQCTVICHLHMQVTFAVVAVYGLQDTTASRAAFLVQMTTVFVPILESIASRKALPPQLWLACSLALAGILCLSLPTGQ
jgi:drug/metabolite transporter (DMT)-like permease